MERILGDYKILKQIAEGSLGTLFLAEHRFIKHHFVLKILPQELASDRHFIARFEEHVTSLTQLSHSSIVKVHNVSYADGVYFLVAECDEMLNLTQYLASRSNPLDEEEILSILMQIASALDYAHSKVGRSPLVHGTLKLSNVLVAHSKPTFKVLLSDFGLSKIIGPAAVVAKSYQALAESLVHKPSELSSLSRSFLENYAFLAPEQKNYSSFGPPADIYAFGILSYYLLAGHFPEALFEMPSQLASHWSFNWDLLIKETLQVRPEKRRALLLPLLEEIQKPKALMRSIIDQRREAPRLESVVSHLQVALPIEERVLASVTGGVESSESSLREAVVTEYQPEKRDLSHIVPIKTEMVHIEGGEFQRGSQEGNRDEMPRHKVILNSFALDIHPVTNQQFLLFLDFIGSEKDENHHDLIRLKDSRLSRSSGKISLEPGYEKHPVTGVTWYGALSYAKWIGKRLPTEAEWEVASGGSLYPTGETIEKSQANFFSSDTAPVMSYKPNCYGLFDMAGNVYEWCQDWYGYNYYETSALEPKNPKGPAQGVYRVLRGGCWKSLKDDLRGSHRHRNNPGAVNGTYGFRCASDAT